MKVVNVKPIGRLPVYDLSIKSENYDEQNYVLENGVISHNTGIYYSSNTIFIISRRQEKKGAEVQGYHFVINVEKSRYVREKSKIPITVTWEEGVLSHSGLLDVALAGGFVKKPSNGWYSKVDMKTGEMIGQKVRADATLEAAFWEDLLKDSAFKDFVHNQYSIDGKQTVDMSSIVDDE